MRWHKLTFIRDNPLIAQTEGPYCLFWPEEGTLCISEKGSPLADHAVITFENLEQKDAEFIISKLKDLRTQ